MNRLTRRQKQYFCLLARINIHFGEKIISESKLSFTITSGRYEVFYTKKIYSLKLH